MDRNLLQWFPLRVSYSSAPRLLQLQELLSAESTIQDVYVAMEYRMTPDGLRSVPAIDNLLFLYTTYSELVQVRASDGAYAPLRYIMHPVTDHLGPHAEALTVPDAQMRQFIRVTSERSDQVVYLQNLAFACRPGARVMITEGPFAGVEGTVKSLQKHLCVVVPAGNVAAVAITGIPRRHLIYIDHTEKNI